MGPAALDASIVERLEAVWEIGPEVLAEDGQRDPILGPARPRDRRIDGPQVELQCGVEVRSRPGLAPHALGAGVALDEGESLLAPAREAEVGDRLVVDREDRRGRAELRAHVADRRPVGERQAGEAITNKLDEGADDAIRTEHLGHDEDEIGRGRAARQAARQPDPDDPRHRLIERLAEEDCLRLDPADPIAEDAEGVDHRRVRVGPDERVGIGDPAGPVGCLHIGDYGREELEVHLVDDAGPGRHDAQVTERRLGPAQELVALAVALVLALDVEGERPRRPEPVDLDGVIDDEIGRDERIDPGRVATEVGHRVAHDGEVDDRRHAGEVLEEDSRGHERHFGLRRDAGLPSRQRLDFLGPNDPAARVTQDVLEENLQCHGRGPEVDSIGQDVESVVVGQPGAEAGPGVEWIGARHAFSVAAVGTLVGWKSTASGPFLGLSADESVGRTGRTGSRR